MTRLNITNAALLSTASAVWAFGMTAWIVGILVYGFTILLADGKTDDGWEMSSGGSKDR